MAGLSGKAFCLSRDGSGAIGGALKAYFLAEGGRLVPDAPEPETVDVAVCTAGKMLIRDAGAVSPAELDELYDANYRFPRLFTERHAAAMRRRGRGGLILHIGSNAARYGNAGAEDYAAFKAATSKYLELRARSLRQHSIRLCVINVGAVDTGFWGKVGQTADPALARQIMPDPAKAMSLDETVRTVAAILALPERVTMKEALVVSVDYQ